MKPIGKFASTNYKRLADQLGYTINEAKDNKSKSSALDKYLNRVENINKRKEGEIDATDEDFNEFIEKK